MSDLANRLRHAALILEGESNTLRRAAAEIERLHEVRAATIEECALHLIAKADLLTNSLHCGDNSMTIADAHRTSKIFYGAAAAIRALKEKSL